MFGFIKSITAKKTTVASVITAFNQAIEDLNAVRDHHEGKVNEHQQTILEAQAALEASRQEAAHARVVCERLQSLISDAL